MPKKVNLQKLFCPNEGKLKKIDDTFTSVIMDEELDSINCTFNYDGCVELDTAGYTYITLSVNNLIMLIDLIEKAEAKYEKQSKRAAKK